MRYFKLTGHVGVLVWLVRNSRFVGKTALDHIQLPHLLFHVFVLGLKLVELALEVVLHALEVVIITGFLTHILAPRPGQALNSSEFGLHLLNL